MRIRWIVLLVVLAALTLGAISGHKNTRRELWVGYSQAAVIPTTYLYHNPPIAAAKAASVADSMLEEYEKRFR